MDVVPFSDVVQSEWDQCANESQDAWLHHLTDWIEIEESYFVDKNCSFAVCEHGRVLALQPLYLSTAQQGTPFGERLIHSGIHRHAGLAVRDNLDPGTTASIEACAMGVILDTSEDLGADRVQLSVQNLSPRSLSLERDMVPFWVRNHNFIQSIGFGPQGLHPAPGFNVLAADQIISLSGSEDELFGRVDRKAIRKAVKAGLIFSTTTDVSAVERYWEVAKISAQRTGEQLPPIEFYQAVLSRLRSKSKALLCFASTANEDVSALVLILDKGSASYLAGVSVTSALHLRPNDFIHWNAMLELKSRGFKNYRLGPIFPEVPKEWPIARVTKFKAKFGARSYPTIVGTRWLNSEAATAAIVQASPLMAQLVATKRSDGTQRSAYAALVAHLLRVSGVAANDVGDKQNRDVLVADASKRGHVSEARKATKRNQPVVLLSVAANPSLLDRVKTRLLAHSLPTEIKAVYGEQGWVDLRTFGPSNAIEASGAIPIVQDTEGNILWCWQKMESSGMILVGTELGHDLMLIRQGQSSAAQSKTYQTMWGIEGERPVYLFQDQLHPDRPNERLADRLVWTLRDALLRFGGVSAEDTLPGGARGAVIVTGDDDQADLHYYAQQAEALNGLPITYFLHHKTKHTAKTISARSRQSKVEWEIHPDALEAPTQYKELFHEQCAWFSELMGRPPRAVRNHGFLNDGYWGHADSWMSHGVRCSSNIPGLDGRILNGSLLPGKLLLKGEVKDHWSILTAIGDGAIFVNNLSVNEGADLVRRAGNLILSSGIPGVLVLNLHPENIAHNRKMHEAARELVDNGFVAWTISEMVAWFDARDRGESQSSGSKPSFHNPAGQLERKPLTGRVLEIFGRAFRKRLQ